MEIVSYKQNRQNHLKAFHARFVLFSSILLFAFSTHHFTVSNETIITSCVSQVVFKFSLTLSLAPYHLNIRPNTVLISFSLIIIYSHCTGFIKPVCACKAPYKIFISYFAPALHGIDNFHP